jgi:hypothetical protein
METVGSRPSISWLKVLHTVKLHLIYSLGLNKSLVTSRNRFGKILVIHFFPECTSNPFLPERGYTCRVTGV